MLDRWLDVWTSNLEAMSETDLEVANYFTATHPKSRMRKHIVCAKALPNGGRVSMYVDNILDTFLVMACCML